MKIEKIKNNLYKQLYKSEKNIKIDESNLLELKQTITAIHTTFVAFKFSLENDSRITEALKSEETKKEFNNDCKDLNKYPVIGGEYYIREIFYIDLKNIIFGNNNGFNNLTTNILKTIYSIENKLENYNDYISIKRDLFDLLIYMNELNLLIRFLRKYFYKNKGEKLFEIIVMFVEKIHCGLENMFTQYLMWEESNNK